MMPKMDGNEVLKQLREHYSQIQLPVIMVTSKSDASDVVEALQNGANDYVIKPVQFDVALKRIETQLTLASQSKAMVRSQELEAINSMVVTYNHQINNALTVGVSYLAMLREDFAGDKRFEKVDASLTRIGEIVRMIQEVAQNGKAEFVVYDGNSKMLNMK
jgi:CheY-like chemotaxis protein